MTACKTCRMIRSVMIVGIVLLVLAMNHLDRLGVMLD